MIDRNARRLLAEALGLLAAGECTNDEFESSEEGWGNSSDPAIAEIAEQAWRLYSDDREYRLEGKHALPLSLLEDVERWRRFLVSELEYQWPLQPRPGVLSILLGLDRKTRREFEARVREVGDVDQWPFLRAEDDPGRRGH